MKESGAGGPGRIVASGDMSCFAGASWAKAHGRPAATRSSPTRTGFAVDAIRFMFALPSVDFECDGVLMRVGDPFVLGLLHVLGGEDELHEVHRLRSAAQACGEPVGARLGQL